jgi:hypothetical protein
MSESKWISLTERSISSPIEGDPGRHITILEADSTKRWNSVDHPGADEATIVALYAAGFRTDSVWNRFNELPEDMNGNFAVNPKPLPVAKRS